MDARLKSRQQAYTNSLMPWHEQQPHLRNALQPANFLSARLATYKRMHRQLQDNGLNAPLPPQHMREFIASEIQTLQHTCALAWAQYEGSLAQDTAKGFKARMARPIDQLLAWALTPEHGGETRVVPVYLNFLAEAGFRDFLRTGVRPADAGSHLIYVSMTKEPTGNGLRLRLDDSLDHATADCHATPPRSSSGRLRVWPAAEYRLSAQVLQQPWMRGVLRQLLRSPQSSVDKHRRCAAFLHRQSQLPHSGVQQVGESAAAFAVQQGDTCMVKNHNRGVAIRLQDSMAHAAGGPRQSVAAAAHRAWHWLKNTERRMASGQVVFT